MMQKGFRCKIEDTGNKNGNAALPDINNVDGTGGSDVQGNIDVIVAANQAVI